VIGHPVLAHSWGWDEVLYFAIPVVLALFWVRWIEVRARDRKAAAAAEAAAAEEESPAG
jgi:hypothetical protein